MQWQFIVELVSFAESVSQGLVARQGCWPAKVASPDLKKLWLHKLDQPRHILVQLRPMLRILVLLLFLLSSVRLRITAPVRPLRLMHNAEVEDIHADWPVSKATQHFKHVPVDQFFHITEGTDALTHVERKTFVFASAPGRHQNMEH